MIIIPVMLVMGCAKKTDITTANNYLTIQNNLTRLEVYKTELIDNKKDLLSYPEGIYDPDMQEPQSLSVSLNEFLNENDCEKALVFKNCYFKTVNRLIDMTELAEANGYRLYMLNNYATRLRGAMDKIITQFPDIKK